MMFLSQEKRERDENRRREPEIPLYFYRFLVSVTLQWPFSARDEKRKKNERKEKREKKM
jgi:hypothetical protein